MTTPKHLFPELIEGQANSETTVNDVLQQIDALLSCRVEDRDLTAPPASPVNGDVYIVAATATGDWAGQEAKLAIYQNGWTFKSPVGGQIVHVHDEAVHLIYASNASSWDSLGSGTTPTIYQTLAITVDPTNALEPMVAMPIFAAPLALTIDTIAVISTHATSGASETEHWTVTVQNAGTGGAGTTEVGSADTDTDGEFGALQAWALNMATGADLNMTTGQVLKVLFAETGNASGQALVNDIVTLVVNYHTT